MIWGTLCGKQRCNFIDIKKTKIYNVQKQENKYIFYFLLSGFIPCKPGRIPKAIENVKGIK